MKKINFFENLDNLLILVNSRIMWKARGAKIKKRKKRFLALNSGFQKKKSDDFGVWTDQNEAQNQFSKKLAKKVCPAETL